MARVAGWVLPSVRSLSGRVRSSRTIAAAIGHFVIDQAVTVASGNHLVPRVPPLLAAWAVP